MFRICVLTLLLFGFFLSLLNVVLPSKITHAIDTETKTAGETGMLNCTVLSRSRAQLIWQRLNVVNGQQVKPTVLSIDQQLLTRNRRLENGQMKYEILLNRHELKGWTFTLVIRSLTQEDAGTYQCMLMLDGYLHNRYPRQQGKLIVQTPPFLDLSLSSSHEDVPEGEDVLLVCKATGNPSPNISWSRPNGVALPGGKSLTKFGETLSIKKVNAESAGLYRCRADNNVRPPGWLDITVRVFYRPSIHPFRGTVGQVPDQNHEAELSCIVKADPPPAMTWWFNGVTHIHDDYKHEVHKFELQTGVMSGVGGNYMTSLRISNVQSGDYGNYTCMAKNRYGTNAAYVKFYWPEEMSEIQDAAPRVYDGMKLHPTGLGYTTNGRQRDTPTCQGANCIFETRGSGASRENKISVYGLMIVSIVCSYIHQ